MIPGRYDLALYHGDTFRRRFALWHDAAKTDPVDLTGASVAAQLRDKPAGPMVIDFATLITAPNFVDIELSAADWAEQTFPAKGAWDLEVTFPSGDVATPIAGATIVTTDVTNSTTP